MGEHESWCKNCVVHRELNEKKLASGRSEKGIIKSEQLLIELVKD